MSASVYASFLIDADNQHKPRAHYISGDPDSGVIASVDVDDGGYGRLLRCCGSTAGRNQPCERGTRGSAGRLRPAGTAGVRDVTRPLYQRLDDEDPELVRVIRKYAGRLIVIAVLIDSADLRRDYLAAVKAFFDALGVPLEREFAAQPQNYPGVRPR